MSPIPWTTVPAATETSNVVIDACNEVAIHSPIATSAKQAINGAFHPRSRRAAMAVTTPRIPQAVNRTLITAASATTVALTARNATTPATTNTTATNQRATRQPRDDRAPTITSAAAAN